MKISEISDEDLEVKGGQGSFQSSASVSTLTDRREANKRRLANCLAAEKRAREWRIQQEQAEKARKEAARQAALESLQPSAPEKKGASLWLLPLLALIPLAYILFRKRG